MFAAGGVVLFTCGCGTTSQEPATAPPPAPVSGIAAEQPPQPEHLNVATPAQERRAQLADAGPGDSNSEDTAPIKASDPGAMPAASAGTNGSFVPPPPSQRKSVTARTTAGIESDGKAILVGRTALAPSNAPQTVKQAISGANQIVGSPYVWGGGHKSWYSDGYDCSGSVSYALGAAGLLSAPLSSSQLEDWGKPGPGKWITVYANAGHTYAVIAGLRWDTVGDAKGTGPRWHAELPYPKGFVVRHPPGY